MHILTDLLAAIVSTIWDLLPIAVIIFGFQIFILRKPIPDLKRIIVGFVLVLLGLGFFLEGLQAALFPLGKLMAYQLTDPGFIAGELEGRALAWRDYYWVYLFAFAIGFATTIAEPSLLAVAIKANQVSGRRHRRLGIANCGRDRRGHRHCARHLPDRQRNAAVLVHHHRLRLRDDTDPVRAAHDHRARLRFRRRHHLDGHRAAGGRARSRARQHRARA